MLTAVVPLCLLFLVVLVKRIPYIGGDIRWALLLAGVAAAVPGRLGPQEILLGVVDGLDKLSWVIAISAVGSIYAESQVRLGTMQAVLDLLLKVFGATPRGLIAALFLTLVVAGSLLGDAIAAATVIGFLAITTLAELRVKPEQIAMMILVGASIGSIMPPISQAVLLSSSLIGTDADPVMLISVVTVGIGMVLAILESFRFVRGRTIRGQDTETLGAVVRRTWPMFGPLLVLVGVVVLNSGFAVDVFTLVPGVSQVVTWLGGIPIANGFVHVLVLSLVLATALTFCYPRVGKQAGSIVLAGLGNVRQTVVIQACAGFMVGMFYASGAVAQVEAVAGGLPSSAVAVVGLVLIGTFGMLTGSQTTAQTVVVPFAAPLLIGSGSDPTFVAVGASHIAAAAQNLPPVGLTAFVVCGLVGATLRTKVDPVRTMLLALPNTLYFMLVGFVFWLL